MQRVLLIGPGGAGKSTLASRVAERTGLPLIHLDALYWRPGWQATPEQDWRVQVTQLTRAQTWIMDGNFGGTIELRLTACDTVILLDLHPLLCLWRVLGRRLRFNGRSKPDMSSGCPERLDLKFLWWILSYRWRRLPALLNKLRTAEQERDTRVLWLRSPAQVQAFVESLPLLPESAR